MTTSSALPVVAWPDPIGLRRALSRHGFAILRGAVTPPNTAVLDRCDELALAFLAGEGRQRGGMRTSAGTALADERPRTRQRVACSKLPLAGIGLHTVAEDGDRVREQIHVVTDPAAMRLVRWPAGRHGGLHAAVREAAHLLHELCTELLCEVEPDAEGVRASQAAIDGDPSVLDLFLYPNERVDPAVNMRTHTDPGLLTATRVSATPGLQVLDAQSVTWVDAEAVAEAGDVILMNGESLELMTRGTYPAAPHRVRIAPSPRLSVVFELRLHEAVRLASRTPPAALLAAPASYTDPAAGVQAEGRDARRRRRESLASSAAPGVGSPAAEVEGGGEGLEYVRCFVAGRLVRGATAEGVLSEFGVPESEWPARPIDLGGAAGLGCGALAEVVLRWVVRCRDREEAEAAFASAEYLTITPAFADCTGRFVEVSWS